MTTIAAESAAAPPAPVNRIMIVVTVMLGTIITVLDMTIANVALPHMAGTVSASTEQISWVLTSYMVATAIMTPLTGWLSGRLGRKVLLTVSVAGFVLASAACGAAQSLEQLVFFRVLQGMTAAPMQPLSQAIILDLHTAKERPAAMAMWSTGMMLPPICGPFIGGWLTETWSWRWVFYINLPIGILCLLGVMTFLPGNEKRTTPPFGLMGFALLSVAIAAAQLLVDRGQGQGWFESHEILTYAVVALVAFWFFMVHSATSARPFLPLRMFADRNFAIGFTLALTVPAIIFAVAALLPIMMQNLYGYPVIETGLLTGTRGLGGAMAMVLGGKFGPRVDSRVMLALGLSIFASTFYWMSTFTLDTPATELGAVGVIQGFGMGLVFLTMMTVAFATLAADLRPDATSVLALARSLGGSVGIAVMVSLWTNFTAIARGVLVAPYSLDNAAQAYLPAPFSLTDPDGVAMLSSEIDRQASMVAYSQVFFMVCFTLLAVIPFLLLLRAPKAAPQPAETAIAE